MTQLRKAGTNDAAAMATLHLHEIPQGLFVQLGEKFLQKVYETAVEDPNSVGIVAEAEGRVCGFVCGVKDLGAFYRRHITRRGISSLPAVLSKVWKPHVMMSVLQALFYPQKFPGDLTAAELIAIAVAPSNRHQGIGRKLIQEFDQRMTSLGVRSYRVLTGENNRPAARFYQSCGFRLKGELSPVGEEKCSVFVKDFSK